MTTKKRRMENNSVLMKYSVYPGNIDAFPILDCTSAISHDFPVPCQFILNTYSTQLGEQLTLRIFFILQLQDRSTL